MELPQSDDAPEARELVERLRRADERALEECYRNYGPLVRSYVARFVPRDDVDDVVQKAYFELWRSRDRLDPARGVVAFLLAVARRRAIDQLRRQKGVIVDVNDLRDLVGDDGTELIDRLTWASEVRDGLRSLSDDQREALELSYFAGLTQQEIAQKLGVPIGTVKARMARGMSRLADRIEKGVVS